MRNLYKAFIFYLCIVLLFSCTAEHFNLSTLDDGTVSKQNTIYKQNYLESMVYCNKFSVKGFSGILVTKYNQETQKFDNNTSRLILFTVPDEFIYPITNYIQIHAFNIVNNRVTFHDTPIEMQIIGKDNYPTPHSVTSIGHDILKSIQHNNASIDTLIQNYDFMLHNLDGWQGISLSVFSARNIPIKSAKILIPPFESNPHTYMDRHHKQEVLSKLHPMWDFAHMYTKDEFFYNKTTEYCSHVPIDFEIPPFKQKMANPNSNLINNLFSAP